MPPYKAQTHNRNHNKELKTRNVKNCMLIKNNSKKINLNDKINYSPQKYTGAKQPLYTCAYEHNHTLHILKGFSFKRTPTLQEFPVAEMLLPGVPQLSSSNYNNSG